jgi:phenylalanyl-tRNA synthetase alpha chain
MTSIPAATDLIEALTDAEAAALAAIEAAGTVEGLAEAKTAVLGKGAALTAAQRSLGSLPPEDRKDAGRALNEVRRRVEARLEARLGELRAVERTARLQSERLDLTEVPDAVAVGHAHVVTQAWEALEDVFTGMGYRVAEGPEVETDWLNFDALNIPPGHPARDGFDTIYVDHGEPGSTVLRTHTSPVQVRTMLDQEPPIYIVAPGRVFRRDTADATWKSAWFFERVFNYFGLYVFTACFRTSSKSSVMGFIFS